MNKAKVKSLYTAAVNAYKKSLKKGLCGDDIITEMDCAIDDRIEKLFPEIYEKCKETENFSEILDLPEYNEMKILLRKNGIDFY